MYEYLATVERVVDGDTLILNVDVGFYIHVIVRCRLLFVLAPELKKRKRDADGAGERVRDWLSLLLTGETVKVQTHSIDRYGRWLAGVWWLNGESVNLAVISKIEEMEANHGMD